MTARRVRSRTEQAGQVTLLVIGFTMVVAMMVVVVVDATAAYLRRQSLDTLADGAALAAADGIEGDHVYTHGLGGGAVVDPDMARALVAGYLESVGAAGRYPGLSHSVESDGERVVVRVGGPMELPLPLPGMARTTYVHATAAAIVTVSD